MLNTEQLQTLKTRNLAIDFYRTIAMLAVAFGHWMAITIAIDSKGDLIAGNALEFNESLSWMSWILQVMPLFFIVGGFSSAISLDSHRKKGLTNQEWVFHRLKRMIYPTVALANFWLLAIGLSFLLAPQPIFELVVLGSLASAIPLWFLANYMIDTAVAPYTLNWYRANPKKFFISIFSTFIIIDILNIAGVPYVNNINWVLGWMIFQIIGFAWKDNALPSLNNIKKIVFVSGISVVSMVAFGPWPMAMVHFPGVEFSPTRPPSLALMLFGITYGFLAIIFSAPLNKIIKSSTENIRVIMLANSFSMSVYLWHMTAAVLTGLLFYTMDWLPNYSVGSQEWWAMKIPFILVSTIFLLILVKIFNRFEIKGLFADKTLGNLSEQGVFALAILFSFAVKLWVEGSGALSILGMLLVSSVWVIIQIVSKQVKLKVRLKEKELQYS